MRKERDGGQEFHSLEEFLLYVKVYLDETISIAAHTWGPEAKAKTLEQLRKVGTLIVAAMEQHGAPQRKGFEHGVITVRDCGEMFVRRPTLSGVGPTSAKPIYGCAPVEKRTTTPFKPTDIGEG